jgi:PPOX class probable F420-dependent enzyme
MSTEQCYAFCDAVARPAILSTVRPDGRPHSAPIWFVRDGTSFVFTTDRESIKGRNLARQPWVSLCIQDDAPPFSYVAVQGNVVLDGDATAVREWATRIGGRYMGADQAETYGERNAVPTEVVVRLTPDRLFGVSDVANF